MAAEDVFPADLREDLKDPGFRREYNRGVRAAQRLLMTEANLRAKRQVEVGYQQWSVDPAAAVFSEAATRVGALIEPEED